MGVIPNGLGQFLGYDAKNDLPCGDCIPFLSCPHPSKVIGEPQRGGEAYPCCFLHFHSPRHEGRVLRLAPLGPPPLTPLLPTHLFPSHLALRRRVEEMSDTWVYPSGSSRETEQEDTCMLRDLFQGIGLCGGRNWQV